MIDIILSNTEYNFCIFTDYLSALLAISSENLNIKTNLYILQIKRKFKEFSDNNSGKSIKLFWIPSHIGIQGNESADLLAKEATTMMTADYKTVPSPNKRNHGFTIKVFLVTWFWPSTE